MSALDTYTDAEVIAWARFTATLHFDAGDPREAGRMRRLADLAEKATTIRELEAPACPACGGSRVIDAPIEYDVSGLPCSGPRPCETCRPDDVPEEVKP